MPSRRPAQSELQEMAEAARARHHVPGVAVGLLLGGRPLVATAGVTSVDDPLPVDADTLFMVGSTTKTFTATALMRLVEQGRVSLDDRVVDHLPRFRLRSRSATGALRLRHLVTHTGGWDGDIDHDTGWGDDALACYVEALRAQPQQFPPGRLWAYNNAGFCVAGRVIEVATGSSYERAVTDLVLRPLGMDHSFFFPHEVATRRFAVGHMSGRRPAVAHSWGLPRALAPAGGLVSTVGDQLTWARFHLGDGRRAGGRRVLRQRTLRLMQRPHVEAGTLADFCGISWLLRDLGGTRLVEHGGNVSNLQLSTFMLVPQHGFAMTVLTNAGNGRLLGAELERWALQRCLGIVQEPPVFVTVVRNGPAPLQDYAGSYESKLSVLEVTLRGAGLQLSSRWNIDIDSVDESEREMVRRLLAARPRPLQLRFTAPDRVAVVRGAAAGTRGEFIREPAGGPVRWLRWGGRLHLRAGT